MPHPSSSNAASVQASNQKGALLAILWLKQYSRVENGELGRGASFTRCGRAELIVKCRCRVKHCKCSSKSRVRSSPSYASHRVGLCTPGSFHPIAAFRCSQVRVFSSIPPLHFGISSSGPCSDSAQNSQVEPTLPCARGPALRPNFAERSCRRPPY